MQEEEMCCCHKHKERSEKEYRDLINRLNRIVRFVELKAWLKRMRIVRIF